MDGKELAWALVSAGLVALLSACGGDDGETGSSGGGTGTSANGVTPCGNFPDQEPKSCQAGQYCADEGFSKCENGCLSNTNCASDQTCVKPSGQTVGSCENKDTDPPPDNCDELCAKAKACDPSITDAQCDQLCAGTNEACQSCILGANCTEINDGTACNSECGVQ